MRNNIYNGPRAEYVDFLVYHAVITESVMLYRGEYMWLIVGCLMEWMLVMMDMYMYL
nr:unnamed protein product [Brassica rapa]